MDGKFLCVGPAFKAQERSQLKKEVATLGGNFVVFLVVKKYMIHFDRNISRASCK